MLVFVAYSDCTSASRAMAALRATWRTRGQRVSLRPMLWRFSQLANPRWSDVATHDALCAECVLLAMDSLESCDAQMDHWLASLRARSAGSTLSAIVAVRDEELLNLSLTGSPGASTPAAVTPATEVIGSIAARRPAVAAA